MIYLIYGNQSYLVKQERIKILNSFFKTKDQNIVFLDSNDGNTLIDALDEYEQLFLTDNLKAVIYKNPKEIIDEKQPNSRVFEKFKAFLNNKHQDFLLIFELNTAELSRSNQYVKLIEKQGSVIELTDISKKDWPSYVKRYFKDKKVNISIEALNEVVNRISNKDLNYFNNEMEKLLQYKSQSIEYGDVVNIVTPSIEGDVFSILDSLINGRKDKALSSLIDLTNNNHDPISLIALIATSLHFMDQVALLSKEGRSSDDIARVLRANVYRVLANLRSLNNITHEKIVEKLDELYDLDKKIKHSYVNALFGLELFILNF